MKVRIMCNHPISNREGPRSWDGKIHDLPVDPLDLEGVAKWVKRKVGFKLSPGHSRVEKGRCILFPARRQVGVHCMWLEPVVREIHHE